MNLNSFHVWVDFISSSSFHSSSDYLLFSVLEKTRTQTEKNCVSHLAMNEWNRSRCVSRAYLFIESGGRVVYSCFDLNSWSALLATSSFIKGVVKSIRIVNSLLNRHSIPMHFNSFPFDLKAKSPMAIVYNVAFYETLISPRVHDTTLFDEWVAIPPNSSSLSSNSNEQFQNYSRNH